MDTQRPDSDPEPSPIAASSLLSDLARFIDDEPLYFFLPHDTWLAGRDSSVDARARALSAAVVSAWRGTVAASQLKRRLSPTELCRAAAARVRGLMLPQPRDHLLGGHTLAHLLGGAADSAEIDDLLALVLAAMGVDPTEGPDGLRAERHDDLRSLPVPTRLAPGPPPQPKPSWDARRLFLHARLLHLFGWDAQATAAYHALAGDFFVPGDVRHRAARLANVRPQPTVVHHTRRLSPAETTSPTWLDGALGARYRLRHIGHAEGGLVLHLDLSKRRDLDVRLGGPTQEAPAWIGALPVSYPSGQSLPERLAGAVCCDVADRLTPFEAQLNDLVHAHLGVEPDASEGLPPAAVIERRAAYQASERPEDRATLALAAFASGQWLDGVSEVESLADEPLRVPWPVAVSHLVRAGILGQWQRVAAWEDRLIGDPQTPAAVLAAAASARGDGGAALGCFGDARGSGDWAALRRYLETGLDDTVAGGGFADVPMRESLADFHSGIPGSLIRASRPDLAQGWLHRMVAAHDSPRARAWQARIALWQVDLEAARRLARSAWPEEALEYRLHMGAIAVLEERWDAATELLGRVLAEAPDHLEANTWMSQVCTSAGRPAEGERYATRALARRNTLGAMVAGALATAQASTDEVSFETYYDGLVAERLVGFEGVDPHALAAGGRDAWAAGLRVLQRRLGGNRTHWMVGLDAAGRLGDLVIPDSCRGRSAAVQYRLGPASLDDVCRRLDALAAKFPHSPHPLTFGGEVLLWAGRYEDAAASFRQALKRRDCRWGYVGAAAAALFGGREEEAHGWLKELEARFAPVKRATTPVYRGRLARLQGRHDDAERDLALCTEEAPSRIGAWVERGLNALAQGDDPLADRCVAETVERCPALVWRAVADLGLPLTAPAGQDRGTFLQACLTRLGANRASRMVTVLDDGDLCRLSPPQPWGRVAGEALRLAGRTSYGSDDDSRREPFHAQAMLRPRRLAPIMGKPKRDRHIERDFLERGWVRLPGGIPRSRVDHWIHVALQRINERPSRWIKEPDQRDLRRLDLDDPSTWPAGRLTFVGDRVTPFRAYSSAVARAVDTLVGGTERLARPGFSNSVVFERGKHDPAEALNPAGVHWHMDEPSARMRFQDLRLNLLALVLLSDVDHAACGTAFVQGSAQEIARRVAGAGGVLDVTAAGGLPRETAQALGTCANTIGRRGDVFLLHPWTLHGAAGELKGRMRLLANPNILGRHAPYRPGEPRSPVERLIHEALR